MGTSTFVDCCALNLDSFAKRAIGLSIEQACLALVMLNQMRGRRHNFIFVLSHMRAGSTLLTHILNSNAQIVGYGETHRVYNSPFLHRLVCDQMRFWRRAQIDEPYVLDKLLWDHYLLRKEILQSKKIRKLFLIREPKGVLTSLTAKLRKPLTEGEAAEYYVNRLRSLNEYAVSIETADPGFFLTYEQLINHTPAVLQALGDWLGLESQLSEEYATHKATGQWEIGDGSEAIKSGHILREHQPEKIEISASILSRAMEAYEKTYAVLSSTCQSISDKTPLGAVVGASF